MHQRVETEESCKICSQQTELFLVALFCSDHGTCALGSALTAENLF